MSSALDDLLRQLRATRRPRWGADARLALLREIGRLAGADDLPEMLTDVLEPMAEGGEVGQAAAAVITQALRDVPAGDYPALEAAARRISEWAGYGHPWLDMTPKQMLRRAPAGAERVAYVGIASFHPNGHVREAAVRQLAQVGEDALLFLLPRLNDWVVEVRAVAEPAVAALLAPASAPAWAEVLPLVAGLEGQGRHAMPTLAAQVAELLADQPELLRSALSASDREVRRAAHRLALGAGKGAASLAVRVAAGLDAVGTAATRDTVVRLQAARAIREGRVSDPEAEAALLSDPSAGVRREVLLGRIHRGDDPGPVLRDALIDSSGSIREIARFFLQKRLGGSFAPAQVARDALRQRGTLSATEVRGALRALAETGTAEDAPLAEGALSDHRPTVRAAALRALARLDPAQAAAHVRSALDHESPAVARAALRLAVDDAILPGIDPERIIDDALASDGPLRREAFRILRGWPVWWRLAPLLRLAAARWRPESVQTALWSTLASIERRVFTSPGRDDVAAIRHALVAAPPDIAERVRAAIGSKLDG